MKKIKNLETLTEQIGSDCVERCFTEYMMLHVAKAKKLDALFSYIENKKETIAEYIPKEENFQIQKRSVLDVNDLLQWLKE